MTQMTGTTARPRHGRRYVVPVIAVVVVAMVGAVLTLAASTVATPTAQAQIADTTCYTINDGEGTMTSWTGGTQTDLGTTGLSQVEALAANQDRNELWTYDNNTQTIYTFTPGSTTPVTEFAFTDGDIDGLTWVNHNDGDITNDQLWGTFRNPNPSVNNGPNEADQIVRIAIAGTDTDPSPEGTVVSGPTNITDPGAGTSNEQDDNDGLIWDAQTGNVYGVIGGDTTANELITIDPFTGSITRLGLTLNGVGILDIESLGAGTDGQLYGTTGEDDVDANKFVSIDKLTGAVTEIGDFTPSAGVNTNVDYEATACLTEVPFSVTPATCYAIDEGNGNNDNHLVQVDIAADGTFSFVEPDLGVVNNGATPPIPARNIEALAYRNGFEPRPIYTQDPATNSLLRISHTDGTDVVRLATPNLGDIDGLTFRNDNDTDPTNDELWGVIRRGGNPNLEDQIVRIALAGTNTDPAAEGSIVGGATTIETNGSGSFNDVDGLAWDPSTDTFYAPIGGNGNINDLITINPTTGAVIVIGSMGIEDIEGIGFTDAGELFGSTGDTGDIPNTFVSIDKATGLATPLGEITIYGDYESLDCAGETPPLLSSLGDFVFLDTDRDGIQDAGEPGVPGVTVNLLDENGDPTGQTDTTGPNGFYGFNNLTPGDYIVEVVEPAGTDFTTQDQGGDDAVDSDVDETTGRTGVITLDPGENDQTNDAGLVTELASLGDFVFEDSNEDGIQDVGEPGIEGVTVNLLDENGDPTGQTTTTDVDGLYSFTGLTPGDYIVEVELPASAVFTTQDQGGDDAADSDVDPATGRTGPITLDAGENDPTNDAGIVPLASLGDFVFFDTDRDGIQDAGEPGVEGVTVNLLDGAGNATGQTTTTDVDGLYSFTGLTPGDYIVEVVEPVDQVFTLQDEGGDDAADSDVDPATGRTGVINLSPGEDDITNDAGLVTELASLGDLVFEDSNEDGVQDPGEPGIAGVVVNLLDENGGPTGQTTTTGADGLYSFDDIEPGNYIVEVVLPADREFTAQDQGGDDATDSDVDPATGLTGVITLDPGENDPTNDAGIVPVPDPVGSISDLVFEDLDGDGVQDPGEPGVEGVTVTLLDGNGDPIPGIDPVTTDVDGLYIFGNLPEGPYIVEFVAPAGTEITDQDQGGDDAADSDADPTTGRTDVINLGAGENIDTVDAGLVPLASLGDFVFFDTDGDGIQDAGEPGVEGVTVNLLDGAGNATGQTTTTDVDGLYSFDDLEPGDYIVEVVEPVDQVFTLQDEGGDDAADSDVDPATGRTGVINLSPGEDDITNDAGLTAPPIARIGNFVWRDNNRDGIQDPGEPGIEGVTVTVWSVDEFGNLDTIVATPVTDAFGEWTLNVIPGDYRVFVARPPGAESFSPQDVGPDDAVDSDVQAGGAEDGFTGIYTIANGDDNQTIDAGIVFPIEPAALGNFVWQDLDADGIQDPGEPGIEGILVEVFDTATNALVISDTTDANGEWQVPVPPGEYSVRFVNTTLGEFTTQNAGGDDAVDSDVDPLTFFADTVTVGEGETNLTVDAGIIFPAIGLAKDISDGPTRIGSTDNYDISYTFIIENLGQTVLTDVTLTDNVAVGLVGTAGSVVSGPTPNAAGDCSTAVALGTQALAVGESCTAVWDFVISNAGGLELAFDNSASVEGTPPVAPPVTDISDDGAETDTDGDGNGDEPGENDPTPALIPALASLGDKVWEDVNGNGLDDDGANGIANVVVNLLDENGVATGQTTTTDTDGLYSFDDLLAGTYIVEFEAPAGRTFTTLNAGADDTIDSDADLTTGQTGPIVLAAGDDDITNDAGIAPLLGSISNLVFEDTDGNGIQDAGEPGVPGVVVNLLDENGVATGETTTTDVDGLYGFSDLFAGTYIVEFVEPADRDFTTPNVGGDDTVDSDADLTTGQTGLIVLDPGENDDTNDAGVTPLPIPVGSISDLVFDDLDGDGVQDAGEPGVPAVTVTLLDGAGNTIPGIDPVVTNATGNYIFANLVEGAYIVDFEAPAGRELTVQDAGVDDTADSDADPTTGETAVINLGPAEDNVDVDAGLAPLLASLGDKVWEDLNGNGVDDDGANGIANVVVNLLDENGVATGQTTTTDTDGLYSFDDLLAGTYIVEFEAPAGRTFTTLNAGADDTIDSDADLTTGQTGLIVLDPGENDPTNDAGIAPLLGSISDLVFEDLDGDGIQDAGEPGIAGATVTLLDGAGVPVPGVAPIVTDATGAYIFDDLLEGDYIVDFEAPAGRELTVQDAGVDDTADSDADPITGETAVISLGAGEDNEDVDAGIAPLLASLGDKVWEDLNGNGVDDDGVNGIANVVVNLLDENGVGTGQTTTTDTDGLYGFSDLLAGTYIVEFEAPAGRTFTTQNAGGDDTIDSDADLITGQTGPIVLAAGDDDPTNDAGIAPLLSSLSDFVWEDLDGDGIQDAGEPGVQGVTVTLLDGAGVPVPGVTPVLTDVNGNYIFDDLLAGDYIVQFTAPDGRTFTTPGAGDGTDDSDADPTGGTGVISLAPGQDNEDIDAGIAPLVPAIGLAKALSDGPTRIGQTDNYNVSYTFIIENLGETPLTDVQLTDNVAVGLAGTTGSVVTGPTPNAAGDCSTAVANGTQTLAVGASCTAVWDFVITNPGGAELAFDNSATVEGTPPVGPPVTDISDDGGETDTDGDGNGDEPGENDPTPALIPALASLGDIVFEDTDGNGVQDAGEPGVGGVSVNLLDENGVATGRFATTVADGTYSFTGLDAGTYIVEFIEPADRDFTTQNAGADDTVDSDADLTTGRTGPIVLAPGDNDDTTDAGVTPLPIPVGSISNLVFDDLNGDGIQDAGEPGIEGVTVTLLDGAGNPVPGVGPEVTDANGDYIFGDLVEGDYIVVFTAPAGRDFSPQDVGDDAADSDADPDGRTAVISLGAGEINTTIDAGIAPLPLGSISDLVFDDLNGDGIQDAGEPGLAGVTVTLLDGDGNPITGIDPVVTDASGNYSYGDLPAGDYIVVFTAPDGREFSPQGAGADGAGDSDADPDGRTAVITLGVGEDNADVDAGIAPLIPAIGLAKDLIGDPVIDDDGNYTITYGFTIENLGETPLTDVGITDDFSATFPGALVTGPVPGAGDCGAVDAFNGTGTLAVGASCTAEWTVTVEGLTPGETYLNTALATGTSPLGGIVIDTSDDGDVVDEDGDGDADEDGENDPTPVTIPVVEKAILGDKVFLDADGDGIQDSGEEPVEGVVVQIFDANGTDLIAEDTTDANGLWQVTLDPGDYVVSVVLPDGFEFSPQGEGDDDSVDSDVDPAGLTTTITLAAGDVNTTVDAGLVPRGSLGNRVFLDANNDGIQDPSEASVPGAIVQLFSANADATKGALVGQQTTPADGTYLFDNLSAGGYIVVVTPPAGFIVGPQDAGADDEVDNDISPVTGESAVIFVGIGQNLTNVDAGVVPAPVVQPPAPFVPPASPPLAIPTITNAPGPAPVPAPVPPAPPLALTGSNSNVLATLAIAMMAVGGTLLIGARREKDME